jgi:hypothetical protein
MDCQPAKAREQFFKGLSHFERIGNQALRVGQVRAQIVQAKKPIWLKSRRKCTLSKKRKHTMGRSSKIQDITDKFGSSEMACQFEIA